MANKPVECIPVQPAWYVRNRHIQSTFGQLHALLRPAAAHTWERLDLPDGDFLELAVAPAEGKPVLLVVTGLGGSVGSHYAQHILHDWCGSYHVVVMHYRGFGCQLNRTAKAFHAGDTADLLEVVAHCRRQHPDVPLYALGISIGGSILLNTLAAVPDLPVTKAVAVSVPYDTRAAAVTIPKFYDFYLLSSLKRYTASKMKQGIAYPVSFSALKKVNSVYAFDDALTAPVYGFKDAEDYYAQSSVNPRLKNIEASVLLISSRDDPFMPPSVLPSQAMLGPKTLTDFSDWGGHVGFHMGLFRTHVFLERADAFFMSDRV